MNWLMPTPLPHRLLEEVDLCPGCGETKLLSDFKQRPYACSQCHQDEAEFRKLKNNLKETA